MELNIRDRAEQCVKDAARDDDGNWDSEVEDIERAIRRAVADTYSICAEICQTKLQGTLIEHDGLAMVFSERAKELIADKESPCHPS